MHPTFLAKLQPQEVRESDGTVRYVVDENAAKKLGSYVNPPLETASDRAGVDRHRGRVASAAEAAAEIRPDGRRELRGRVGGIAPAPAPPRAESGGGFSSLFASTS